jgi:UDP-N-acetylmuramoyl-tripeptide--D-alanyl-D-alanine ligase
MIQPKYGVVTSIGREHLEFFGDLGEIITEEGWLAELLPTDGKLFVNGDSVSMDQLVARSSARAVRVGFGPKNDWRIVELKPDDAGVTFCADTPDAALTGEYRVNLLGRHQAINALLAAAVGAELGLTRDEIQRGLTECLPAKMRMQVWNIDGIRVLDDAYNANADSMAVALHTLMEFPCDGRRVAVLGDMAELGRHSAEAHAEVGHRAAESKVDQLFAVGKMAGVMGAAARASGLLRVTELGEVETAASSVRNFVRTGDAVLVKASRSTRLERVVEVLRGNGK